MATYSNLQLKYIKQLADEGGGKRKPIRDLTGAAETSYLFQATHDADKSLFGVIANDSSPNDQPPKAAVMAAAQDAAQQWVDDNPAGDPGDPPTTKGGGHADIGR